MCVLCARMCLASVLFCSRSDRSRCNQWRCVRIATANYQINEEIRDKEVRVIGADGVEDIIEFNLPDDEQAQFKHCCDTIRANIAKCKKLLADK